MLYCHVCLLMFLNLIAIAILEHLNVSLLQLIRSDLHLKLRVLSNQVLHEVLQLLVVFSLEVKANPILLPICDTFFLYPFELFPCHAFNRLKNVSFIVCTNAYHRVAFHGCVENLRDRKGDLEFITEILSYFLRGPLSE